jgi:hypothetical protein
VTREEDKSLALGSGCFEVLAAAKFYAVDDVFPSAMVKAADLHQRKSQVSEGFLSKFLSDLAGRVPEWMSFHEGERLADVINGNPAASGQKAKHEQADQPACMGDSTFGNKRNNQGE